MIYGVFLSFTWFIIFIAGCVITGASVTSESTLEQLCDGKTSSATFNKMSTWISEVEGKMNSYINSNMCSLACPCDE